MNSVVISGRLTKDISKKATKDLKFIVFGSIAVKRGFKDKDGKYGVDFIDFVVANERTINYLETYVAKGDLVEIAGVLSTREYNGSKRVDVVVEKISLVQKTNAQPVEKKVDDPLNELPYDIDEDDDDGIPF